MFQYHFDTEVYNMLANFRAISGLRVGIHDLNMEIMIEYPKKSIYYDQLRFCDKIRYLSPDFAEKCRNCDLQALESVKATRKPMIYHCHAGFTEALIPIIANDEIICVMMIGQIRDDRMTEEGFGNIIRTVRKTEEISDTIQLEDLRDSYNQMPQIDSERLRALVYFLEICAQNIFNNHLIKRDFNSLSEAFIGYIDSNLYNAVTIRQAADTLCCSTSHLSRIISRDLHSTFTEYLTSRRIEVAKQLLQTTSLSVKTIALTLCFEEPTYFMRVFKRYTGMTCSEFRKAQ